jgi:hypothetical protein
MLRWVYFPGTTCPRITLPFRPYIGRLFILIRSRAKFFLHRQPIRPANLEPCFDGLIPVSACTLGRG